MTSDFIRRQVLRFLDDAAAALAKDDWGAVRAIAVRLQALDPDNADAAGLLAAAERALGGEARRGEALAGMGLPIAEEASANASPLRGSATPQPASFANGRYAVKRFLGEGGKKKV